ncbi:LPP20 family lipoprotein [Candidatus Sumerlaeota bacterium]|nr:LPP20 family lipoprotein [Candidatus Sumerlaeota bacterium]
MAIPIPKSSWVAAAAFIFLLSTAAWLRADSIQSIGANGGVNWTQGTIFAEGFGVVHEDQADAKTQRKLMARRAALNDAYRNLAETVDGVRVDSETTVKNMAVSNDVVRTQVQSFIQGMRPVKTEYEEDDDGSITATVLIEAPLNGAGGLSNMILPFVKEQVLDKTQPPAIVVLAAPESRKLTVKATMADYQEPEPSDSSVEQDDEPADEDDSDEADDADDAGQDDADESDGPADVVQHPKPSITGVVFDASGTEYGWNMFPRVVSEDQRTVFDISVTEKWKQQGSFTPFQETVQAGRSNPRVAADPIIIKARKIDGVTIYVSNADADRIIAANNEYSVLLDGKVLFVIME